MTEDSPAPQEHGGHDAKALRIATIALVVSIAGAGVSIFQATTARQEATTARNALTNTLNQEQSSQARKVSATTTFTSADKSAVVVTNAGTTPVHFVTVYLADDSGKPVAQYGSGGDLDGCTTMTFISNRTSTANYVVTFDDANGITWGVFTQDGTFSRPGNLIALPTDDQGWAEKATPARNCS